MPKPALALLSVVLCSALVAACGGSGGATTTQTTAAPSARLGDAGQRDWPLQIDTYHRLESYSRTLKSDVQRHYTNVESCLRPAQERREACLFGPTRGITRLLTEATDRFEALAKNNHGACGNSLRAHSLAVGEAGRPFAIVNALTENPSRHPGAKIEDAQLERFHKAIAEFPAAYATVLDFVIDPSCKPKS
jgi:hypothetical protein